LDAISLGDVLATLEDGSMKLLAPTEWISLRKKFVARIDFRGKQPRVLSEFRPEANPLCPLFLSKHCRWIELSENFWSDVVSACPEK